MIFFAAERMIQGTTIIPGTHRDFTLSFPDL
jgi:hypothetical protein